jgi:HK97 gp10 family phage protein
MKRELVMIAIKVEGTDTLRIKFSKMSREIDKELKRELNKLGLEMLSFIRKSMKDSPPDTSKVYKRTKKKLIHNPSFPGNFPRPDSGNLIKNITYHTTYRGLTVGDHDKTPYAVFLESGTRKMEARPFIVPTWEKYIPTIENRMNDLLKRIIG